MRVFCRPARDKLMICSPTYGMYNVCAAVNEVEIVDVPLIPYTWQIDTPKVFSSMHQANSDCIGAESRSNHKNCIPDHTRQSDRRPNLPRLDPRTLDSNMFLLERRRGCRRSLHRFRPVQFFVVHRSYTIPQFDCSPNAIQILWPRWDSTRNCICLSRNHTLPQLHEGAVQHLVACVRARDARLVPRGPGNLEA